MTHSERRLTQALEDAGIDRASVTEICSELEPCELSGAYCKNLLAEFPNLEKVYYNYPYPPGKAGSQIRRQSVESLAKTVDQHNRELSQSKQAMDPCATGGEVRVETGPEERRTRVEKGPAERTTRIETGSAKQATRVATGPAEQTTRVETGAVKRTPSLEAGAIKHRTARQSRRVLSRASAAAAGNGCAPGEEADEGALTREISDPVEALDPGGIDFTSLQLRYLSLSGPHQGDVQYAMSSDGAPLTKNAATGLHTAREDSAAFFTWLTLPPRSFWVNLEPNYPPKIIDPTFGLTDAGRVLLQSDLLLKEAMTQAKSPNNPIGLQFAQGLANLQSTSADENPCVGFRIWIVPGVATVHATKTRLYILNAPLNVKLAVVTHLPGKVLYPLCPQDAWYTGQEALIRQLLLPELIQEVNTAPQFEPLRRVYMSRVAAQWARQRAGRRTVLGRLVNSGLHLGQVARPRWSSNAVWEQYMKQLDAPPATYTVPVQQGGTTVNDTFYVYGGVDFTHRIPTTYTSNRTFAKHWPGLAAAARRSIRRASTADGTTLIGGGTSLHRRTPISRRHRRPSFLFVPRAA